MVGSAKAALFDGLIDDASLFPPAQYPMARALRAHARNRESAYARMQGRFVVPASRLAEMCGLLEAGDTLRISVISDGDVAGDLARITEARTTPGITIDALEIRSVDILDLAPIAALWADAPVSVWFEAPYDSGWAEPPELRLAAIAAARSTAAPNVHVGAKIRCGGSTANLFPSVDDVTAFIVAAHAAGVPWKATAGLHHPIRHIDAATGFLMHGFLNLAIAACAHHAGVADRATVAEMLADTEARSFTVDPRHAAWREGRVEAPAIVAARSAAFRSYGSCSFAEPVLDLLALGMLA